MSEERKTTLITVTQKDEEQAVFGFITNEKKVYFHIEDEIDEKTKEAIQKNLQKKLDRANEVLKIIAHQIKVERASGNAVSIGMTSALYDLISPPGSFLERYKASPFATESEFEPTIYGATIRIVVDRGLRFWIMKGGGTIEEEEAEP